MTDAFLCDAIRTPIGRLNGALASVRADDLAAIPIRALVEHNPGVDWSAVDDAILWLRQPGRRGQSQCRAHGGVAGGPARDGVGLDHQPAVRGRGSTRSARRRARSAAVTRI
jgi:acetyl-CoA C-acetyltransferase